jgi:hypothetical protein
MRIKPALGWLGLLLFTTAARTEPTGAEQWLRAAASIGPTKAEAPTMHLVTARPATTRGSACDENAAR